MISHAGRAAKLLAAGQGSLKERLHGAALEMAVLMLQPEEVPEDLREEAAQINRALTSSDLHTGGGPIEAAIRTMNDEQASRLAVQILDFYVRFNSSL
jgi:hypothetical protein